MKTLEASPRYHSPMVNKIYHNGWHILFEPQDPTCFGVIRAKKVTTVLSDWRYWRILFISLFWGHQRPVQFSIAISNPAKGVDAVKDQAAAIWNSGFRTNFQRFSLEGNVTYWYVWTLIRPSKTILNARSGIVSGSGKEHFGASLPPTYCKWGPWPYPKRVPLILSLLTVPHLWIVTVFCCVEHLPGPLRWCRRKAHR